MSSISDAIAKQRPDLNKQARFQRNGLPAGPDASASIDRSARPAVRTARAPVFVPEPSPVSRAERGWFGLPWPAGTRSRLLALTLLAICLGIAIGFYPRLGRVKGIAEWQTADLAAAGGAKIGDMANAEIDDYVARLEGAATETFPTADADATSRSDESTEEATPATPAESLSLNEVGEPSPMATATTPGDPPDAVSGFEPDAESATVTLIPVSTTPELSAGGATAGDAPMVVHVRIRPEEAPAEEVLYEAVPRSELVSARPPAARDDASGSEGYTDASTKTSARSTPSVPAPTPIVLSGIFWDKTQPMAMINGEIVEVGQSIDGAQILEIRPEVVVVRQDGKQRFLRL